VSLDDADTLVFHRDQLKDAQDDKVKDAQDALDQVPKTRKQDKLIFTVTKDAAHNVGPADH